MVYRCIDVKQEGRSECYCIYIEPNCFSFFLSMQYANKGPRFKGLSGSYDSKVTPVGPLNAEKLAEAVLL